MMPKLDGLDLRKRIRTCERIVNLERNLEERNRNLIESNKKLGEAYSMIKKDLEAAGKIHSRLPAKDGGISDKAPGSRAKTHSLRFFLAPCALCLVPV